MTMTALATTPLDLAPAIRAPLTAAVASGQAEARLPSWTRPCVGFVSSTSLMVVAVVALASLC